MGQGKQEVYFSEHCLQEGISINGVLQTLIGDTITTPSVPVETSGTDESLPVHEEEMRNNNLSQTTLQCTSKAIHVYQFLY